MCLGKLLFGRGLVSAKDLEAELERRRQEGGPLGRISWPWGRFAIDKLVTALRGLREVGPEMCARRPFQRSQPMHGPDHPNTHRAHHRYARALLVVNAAAAEHASARAA